MIDASDIASRNPVIRATRVPGIGEVLRIGECALDAGWPAALHP
jgi:hypothetical protein